MKTWNGSGNVGFERLFGWAVAVLVLGLMVPGLCQAGVPDYPSSVQADPAGNWSVTILVTGTTDPKFHNDPPVNSLLSSRDTIKLPDGSFKIVLKGRLINPRKSGSLTFTVDPEGLIVKGTITILAG